MTLVLASSAERIAHHEGVTAPMMFFEDVAREMASNFNIDGRPTASTASDS
jgi:hypothetical protein